MTVQMATTPLVEPVSAQSVHPGVPVPIKMDQVLWTVCLGHTLKLDQHRAQTALLVMRVQVHLVPSK